MYSHRRSLLSLATAIGTTILFITANLVTLATSSSECNDVLLYEDEVACIQYEDILLNLDLPPLMECFVIDSEALNATGISGVVMKASDKNETLTLVGLNVYDGQYLRVVQSNCQVDDVRRWFIRETTDEFELILFENANSSIFECTNNDTDWKWTCDNLSNLRQIPTHNNDGNIFEQIQPVKVSEINANWQSDGSISPFDDIELTEEQYAAKIYMRDLLTLAIVLAIIFCATLSTIIYVLY